MNVQTENKNKSKDSSKANNNKEMISKLEKEVSLAIWIQTFGKVMEVISLTKLFLIDEEARSDPNERQVVEGVWIQTIGQILEAIGVTGDVLSEEELIKLEATSTANIGDWLQGIGAIYEAHAGRQIVVKDREELVTNIFVP